MDFGWERYYCLAVISYDSIYPYSYPVSTGGVLYFFFFFCFSCITESILIERDQHFVYSKSRTLLRVLSVPSAKWTVTEGK